MSNDIEVSNTYQTSGKRYKEKYKNKKRRRKTQSGKFSKMLERAKKELNDAKQTDSTESNGR